MAEEAIRVQLHGAEGLPEVGKTKVAGEEEAAEGAEVKASGEIRVYLWYNIVLCGCCKGMTTAIYLLKLQSHAATFCLSLCTQLALHIQCNY